MSMRDDRHASLSRLFFKGFTAMDLAEPLVSFDAEAEALKVRQFLLDKDFDRVGVREEGLVRGYARREALTAGRCGEHLVPFGVEDEMLPESASLVEVVGVLAVHRQCFVTLLDRPAAIITLDDLEKPAMRMFLFGVITLAEMAMTEILRRNYADGAWQAALSPARLEKAQALRAERERRGQRADLIDCLQFGDKGSILSYDKTFQEALGFTSRREVRQAVKELEMLRNNLAHTQAIVPDGWQRIVILCGRMEQNLMRLHRLPALGGEPLIP